MKNPQFLSNPNDTVGKWLPHKVIIFFKFHEDWTKIVDFYYWPSFEFVWFFLTQTLNWFFFQSLENDASEELQLQLKVFQDHRDEDFDEFAQRFDNIRLELDDVDECFELVKNLVMDTNAEPFFLSILQHMICIRDDTQIR